MSSAETAALHIINELSEHITLRIGSCQEDRHDWQWTERKTFTDYDLWFVLEGHIDIEMGGVCQTANAGNLILFYPDLPYTAGTGAEGCRFIYVHFDFGVGGRARMLSELDLAGIIPGAAVSGEASLFLQAFEQYKRRTSMSGIRLKGCLTILLATIIGNGNYRDAPEALPEGGGQPGKRHSRHMEAMQPLFAYMDDHLHRPIAIRELAELAGMSEKYFINVFKMTVGVTPGSYLYQMRMNRAREYLYQRTYSIKQIAELLGYPDPYTFSKAFKKYYRCPPSQFV